MTFKTAAEMFGDGGGFGPAVPYDTSNPPGTSAGNRGIQFGEQLTAAIANRTHYALALNDEDLNTRLVSFETDGLDAAYRLGTVALAGGGRLITLDGGAVETQSAKGAADPLDDVSDAHFRADASSDTVDGTIGFEFKGRNISAGGSPRYGFLDRRGTSFNTSRTVIGYPHAGTLNLAGVGTTRLTLSSGQTTNGSSTDLILGLDLVEIISSVSGNHLGLYVVMTLPTSTSMTLAHLNGTNPSFTASDVVSFRVYRPALSSAGPYSTSATLVPRGVCIAGVPTDVLTDAALTLVPGSRDGVETTGVDGVGYALKVRQVNGNGTLFDIISISADGSYRVSASSINVSSARRLAGTEFANPSFHAIHATTSEPYEVGFVASRNNENGTNYYGMLALEQALASDTFVFPASGTGSGTGIDVNGSNRQVSRGQLIEILTPSAQAGIYVATDVVNDRVVLRHLSGVAVSGFPTDGSAGTYRKWSGMQSGRFRFPTVASTMLGGVAPNQADASMVLHPPDKQASGTSASDAALMIYSHSINAYAIRVIGAETECFTLNTNGFVRCEALIAEGIAGVDTSLLTVTNVAIIEDLDVLGDFTMSGNIIVDPPVATGYMSVPTGLWQPERDSGDDHWVYIDNAGRLGWFYNVTNTANLKLWIPLSGTDVPSFAELTSVRIRYVSSGATSGQLGFRLVNISATEGVINEIEDFGGLDHHNGGYAAETFTVSPAARVLTFSSTTYLVIEPAGSPAGSYQFASAEVAFNWDYFGL